MLLELLVAVSMSFFVTFLCYVTMIAIMWVVANIANFIDKRR